MAELIVNQSITHVLVPVDPDDIAQTAQLAAMQLAANDGALVTLLYVHDRPTRTKPETGLDALSNLHDVMLAPPQESQIAPVYPDPTRERSIHRLREIREGLIRHGFDESQVRVAFRYGDPKDETASFIEEAGVDVVFIQSPATSESASLRRLAHELQHDCPCQLQIVHPARRKSPAAYKRALLNIMLNPTSVLQSVALKFGWPSWRKMD